MATAIKRLLAGNPRRAKQAAHERLSKKTALAILAVGICRTRHALEIAEPPTSSPPIKSVAQACGLMLSR